MHPHSQAHPTAAYNFFLLLLLGVSIVVFLIFKPFISPLILAAAFAVVFHPLYKRLRHHVTGGRETLAALFTLLIVIALIIVPLLFVGGLMFNEARDLYLSLRANDQVGTSVITQGLGRLEQALQNIAPEISLDIRGYAEAVLAWVLSNLSNFFSGFIHIVINMFIMLITLFFLLRDGDKFRQYIVRISPLPNADDDSLLRRVENSINSVVKGSIVVALVQGIIATIGYTIFGLPNPIIWGTVTAIAALIPGIGTAIVLVPAIIFLFFSGGGWGSTIGLTVWGLVAVGLIDNVLAPYLINRGTRVHELLILISVLGGITFFGPIGFIVGPVIMSLFLALLEMYPRFGKGLAEHHQEPRHHTLNQ